MTVILPSFKLPKVEWLFKQSNYGGVQHLAINIDEWAAYINSGDFRTELRIETLCGKRLKFNPIWSVMKARDGLVRNICPECVINYDSEAKGEEAEKRKAAYDSRPDKEYPF